MQSVHKSQPAGAQRKVQKAKEQISRIKWRISSKDGYQEEGNHNSEATCRNEDSCKRLDRLLWLNKAPTKQPEFREVRFNSGSSKGSSRRLENHS